MNLLVFGDYNYGDPDTFALVGGYLDAIHKKAPVSKIVTFNEDGVSYLSTVWADDEKVPYSVYEIEGRYNLNSKNHLPNWFLRRAVEENKIDAFLFVFLQKAEDKSHHRTKIRYLYRKAKRKYVKPVYVNLEDNKISIF